MAVAPFAPWAVSSPVVQDTVEAPDRSPVRVSVKVRSCPSRADASAIEISVVALPVMVPVAVLSSMVAPVGSDSVTVKSSSISVSLSVLMATLKAALVAPAAMVTVPVLLA